MQSALSQIHRTVTAAPDFASIAALHPSSDGHFMLTVLAFVSALIGFVCSCFLVRERKRVIALGRTSEEIQKQAAAGLAFRDALLGGADEAVVVLPIGHEKSLATDNGNARLQSCMGGPNAKKLAGAVEGLLRRAEPFALTAVSADARAVSVRGKMIESRAVLFMRDLGDAAADIDYRAVLDAIPTPAWVRDASLNLLWGNSAFLEATGSKRLQDAVAVNAALERSEYELAGTARDGATSISARRYALVGAKRRALSFSLTRLANASVAGVALDVTEVAQAEAMLRLANDATSDMLDGLPVAVAIFDKDRHLQMANQAYRNLWNFTESWLATHPSLGAVYDRLRETRQLPEQQDYQAWKHGQLKQFESFAQAHEEFWHVPGGRSVKVTTRPHLLGGIYMTFEDITAQLRLEASFKLLTQVQRATLDTVDEGIAIFAPDGRLVLHNKKFARLWHLTEDELAGEPHYTYVGNIAQARVGKDDIWSIVAAGLAGDPERCSEWGKARRADGRIISLAMSRLPNGATAVTFTDLTDLERFSELNAGGSDVAA